jgi:hypothetical protein
MDLFGQIERVRSLKDVGYVLIASTDQPTLAEDSAGRLWVRKRVLHTKHESLLAEALGWLVGRALGVPTPDAAVSGEGEDLSWLSLHQEGVLHWDPRDTPLIENLPSLGRMLALDAILFNEDRHEGNLLLQPNPDPEHLRAWAIDMGMARVGWPRDFAKLGMKLPSVEKLVHGLPVEVLSKEAHAAAEQAVTLSSSYSLGRYVDEACAIAGEPQRDLLLEALAARMKYAPELVATYLQVVGTKP